MSDFFKVVSVGLDKAILEVDGIVKKLKPPKCQMLLSILAHTFVEDAKQNFDDPSNRPEPWADKKVYKRGKGYIFAPSNLKKTGSLLRSIKLKHLNFESAGIVAVGEYKNEKTGKVYSGYARFHQEGTPKMPRRPFFAVTRTDDLTPEIRGEFESIIQKYLSEESK